MPLAALSLTPCWVIFWTLGTTEAPRAVRGQQDVQRAGTTLCSLTDVIARAPRVSSVRVPVCIWIVLGARESRPGCPGWAALLQSSGSRSM